MFVSAEKERVLLLRPVKNRTSEEEEEEGKSVSLEDSAGGYDACGKRDRGVEEAGCVLGRGGGKMRRKQEGETDILEMAAGKWG